MLNPIIGAYSVFQNPIENGGLVVCSLIYKINMVFKTKETVMSTVLATSTEEYTIPMYSLVSEVSFIVAL